MGNALKRQRRAKQKKKQGNILKSKQSVVLDGSEDFGFIKILNNLYDPIVEVYSEKKKKEGLEQIEIDNEIYDAMESANGEVLDFMDELKLTEIEKEICFSKSIALSNLTEKHIQRDMMIAELFEMESRND